MEPSSERIPSGPRLPAALQTLLLFAAPIPFLRACQRRHGPIFRVRLLGFPGYVYVARPDLARAIYAADRTVGRAGDARRDFLEPVVGPHSLLVTEDEQWLRHRKLLGPALHRNHVDSFRDEMAAIASAQIATWPRGQPAELRPLMQRITLEVILRLVFGVSEGPRLDRYRTLLPRLLESTAGPAVWLLPPSLWRAAEGVVPLVMRFPNPVRTFLRRKDELDALLREEIVLRRADLARGAQRGDILSMLLRARDEDGRALDDDELHDELITLLEAGHETTATALAWTFERLVRSPRVLARLVGELEAGGGEEYLDAVIRESLRARPVIMDTPRVLTGPLALGPYVIPAGWFVAPAIPNVQSDRTTVGDPGEFRPERFLDAAPPRDAWIPFGGGKRHCVGSHLALLEMRVVIAAVLRTLDVAAVDARGERARTYHVTLVPARGARVMMTERAGADSRGAGAAAGVGAAAVPAPAGG